MSMRMLIDARHPEETRVAVIQGNRIEEFDFESALREQLKGNIYLAKVTRVEPSLQAAFVEYGGNRHGFLAFSEIHPDYYQIPKEDRDALLRAEREAAEAHHAEMDARHADDEDDLGGEDNHEDERGEEHDDDHVDDRPAPSEVGEHDDHTTEAMRTKRQNLRRHYKIQEVIKRRQVLLVQVVKEERGNKGAALTTYLSLAGRYCVFMPNTNHGGGISRKISSQADRKRLKSIVSELKLPPGMGCIVRTAGLSRTKVEIKRDFDYLTRLWDEIRDRTLASSAPALIHEDSDLIKRAIRDIYNREIDDVVVDGAEGFKAARSFMKLLMPSHAKKVQQYVDPVPLFQRYQVEAQLAAMYHPVVQLKSGGYIVINPTEALVSIDINSGKSTREHNIEETALKTNIEAANEIARQLRLRDMAGLVVIDFIDMDFHGNNRKVERALKEALKNDRARIQLGRISTFGLLEMSRQRLRTGVLEASTHVCPVCDGAGIVRTLQSASLGALRVLEAEALKGKHSHITLRLPFEVAVYMLNVKRAQIANVEQLYGVTAEITPNGDLTIGEHEIDGGGPPPVARVDLALPVAAIIEDDDDVPEDEDEDEEVSEVVEKPRERGAERDAERTDESGRRRRRGRGRGRGRDDNRPERIIEADREGESESVESEAPDAAQDGGEHAERDGGESEGSRRKRRRRGRRGGRRKPAEGQREDADEAGEAEPGEAVQADMPEAALIHADTGEAPRPRGRGRSKKPDSVAVEAATVPIPDTAEPVTAEKPRASRRKAVDVAPKPDAARSDGAVIGIVAETVKPKAPRRKAAAKKSGDTGTVSASIDPARAANDAAGEDTGPPRKGWWQRTFGE